MARDPNKLTAYPVPLGQTCDDFQGVTIRDYFAAKAMAALIAKLPRGDSNGVYEVEYVARSSYIYADAMIAARGESGGSN